MNAVLKKIAVLRYCDPMHFDGHVHDPMHL